MPKKKKKEKQLTSYNQILSTNLNSFDVSQIQILLASALLEHIVRFDFNINCNLL
jgi:hypothetical protein